MALSIYNNVYSMTAQRALSVASSAQGKSLERLSTGLRINSAADDASGLAISEKLRSQIRGFQKAAINAQDGISYLQTAEGGMEVMTAMLQRMRELAVQAGNGIYTTNDRAMLQLEVDQLKDEINRVSRATEFNTKKLLNGDACAIWSSDQEYVEAIVRGPEVAEGNYKIEAVMDPGLNEKYKTDIMKVNEGVLVSEIVATPNGNPNLTSVRDPENIPVTGTSGLTVSVAAANIDDTAVVTTTYQQDGSNWNLQNGSSQSTYNGYFELEFTSNGLVQSAAGTPAINFKYRVMNAKTGELSEWRTGQVTKNQATSAIITMNASLTGGTTNISLKMPYDVMVKTGDKALGYFQDEVTVPANLRQSGGGTIAVDDGPIVAYTQKGELTKADDDDGRVDYNEVTYHMANMDPKTGVVAYGSLTMEFQEGVAGNTPGIGVTETGQVTVNIRDTGVATKDTKLSDIAVFTNDDGVNILANTQELKIYNGNEYASVFLEADDTVEDFIEKMNKAIIDDLDLGADDLTSAGRTVNDNLVNYVNRLNVTQHTAEAVPGTFIIQTAKLGQDSKLVFVGDQQLIDALSLATIQEAENSSMDIRITDAHTGKFIGEDNVGDGMIRNVIKGIDVKIEQNFGIEPVWNDRSKMLEFNATGEVATAYLHVVDSRTELQIGANQGQTINVSVGQLDTTGLEIDDVYVVDMELAQKAITKLDKAIERVNASRATLGAQINRLEYTIQNLHTARENLTAAESRIRDLDIAEETANLTKNQVLVQAATAMVAQANQIPQQALALLQG